jgi:hypothetical protein
MEAAAEIRDSALAASVTFRTEALNSLVKKLFGNKAKVRIEIEDAEQKHVDFLQDCGHDSPDDYSVRIHGEDYTIKINSVDRPLPF